VSTANVVINGETSQLNPANTGANGGMLTIGSEESGGVQHVYAYNLKSDGTNGRLLYMKSNMQRGGVCNDIHVDTANVTNLKDPIAFITFNYSASGTGGPTGFIPTFSNITMSNTIVNNFPETVDIEGLSTDKIGPITFTNNTWTNKTNVGNKISNATTTFTNTKLNGAEM
jgi:polygalacturonase